MGSLTEKGIPRFLTIRQTAATNILPEACLRRMARDGTLPGLYSGRKFLVNFDLLIAQLNSEGAKGGATNV